MSCIFNNISFNNVDSSVFEGPIDLFIVCVGYEERSYYIYNKLKGSIKADSVLILAVNDFSKYPKTKSIIEEAQHNSVEFYSAGYSDYESVQEVIVNRIKKTLAQEENAKIHIDYSAMPRSWYCGIPELLEGVLTESSEVYFWYSEGEYESFDDDFPTVGIDSYILYSGKPSILEKKRTHFIGVGYDSIRTNGIIALLNPESVITCEANNPIRTDVLNKVEEVNREILDESFMNLSLDITDVEFMISKMCGIANEIYTIAKSDIILVPDGPKPLIFIMSMIPWLIGKQGVCCLHILRNDRLFKPQNVKALGKDNTRHFSQDDHLIGFSVKLKNKLKQN